MTEEQTVKPRRFQENFLAGKPYRSVDAVNMITNKVEHFVKSRKSVIEMVVGLMTVCVIAII